jgi:hypothetical protein
MPQGVCLKLPVNKGANSWRVIILNINGKPRFYLRWTLSKWLNKLVNPRYYK